MKQNLLIPAALLLMAGNTMAQTTVKVPKGSKMMSKVSMKTSKHINAMETNQANLATTAEQLRATTITSVGTTTYQLQSNYSVGNRIILNGDGTTSATFTYSNSSGAFSDRGTGYLYNNGTSWSAIPTARVESERTGWPEIAVCGDNSESIITHNTVQSNLMIARRGTKGTGAFTESFTALASAAPLGNFWPRAAVGGTSNNTIHVISISNPVDAAAGNAPVYYMGQQGALTYCRSQDNGVTWDVLHNIPAQHDSTQYDGFSADTYSIDAKGNTVAYVVGGSTNDLFLMKSTDNGTTWTKTNIMTFPIPFFNDQLTDINGDSVIDTVDTNDGAVSVLVDNSGKAHVWFGQMRILNDDSTDAQWSYFPGTDGLMYWSEGMSAPVLVAAIEDIDGDLNITFAGGTTPWGTYQCSLTGQPDAGIDPSGNIYVTYASIVEYSDLAGKCARNIYYMVSNDGGTTWSTPMRVNADDFNDQVFCSISRHINSPSCLKMIYQSDYAAGHGVQSTNPDYADNSGVTAEIIYACVDAVTGVSEVTDVASMISLYPNPSSSQITLTSMNVIERYEVIDVTGKRIMNGAANATQVTLDVTSIPSGLYMVNVFSNNQRIAKSFVKE